MQRFHLLLRRVLGAAAAIAIAALAFPVIAANLAVGLGTDVIAIDPHYHNLTLTPSNNDTGVVPVHFQVSLWATRDGISYVPRTDENTLAWKFRPTGPQ